MLRIEQNKPFNYGYNPIATIDEKEDNAMMDFGILKLLQGQVETYFEEDKEILFLLIQGEVTFEWEGNKETVKRSSCFDEDPFVLHVSRKVKVTIKGEANDTEISVSKTDNDRDFPSKLYTQEECRSEDRGKGTMKEASTRIVRTVLDYSNGKHSNLVIGEVVDYPGKWSSYPPHHHPQPEIYFYKFNPSQGYGFCELGDDVVKVKNNYTTKILNDATHPQSTAPGYAMYYIWVIRHIDDNPYITPVFLPEHLWVTNPDSKIWPDK